MKFARSFPALALLCACASSDRPAPDAAVPAPDAPPAPIGTMGGDAPVEPKVDGAPAARDAAPVPDAAPAGSDGGAPAFPVSMPRKQWSCPAGPFPAPRPGPSQAVCGNVPLRYDWNEGPTWIASQNAFFFSNFTISAGKDGDMLKYTPATSACEVFIPDIGCNGLAVASDGTIIAACPKSRSVMKVDPATKAVSVVASMAEGMMLDTPNDIVVHSNGTIYFTNPTNDLAGRPPGYGASVLRIDPTGTLTLVARGSPNGIALSPDERRLYVVFMGIYDLDERGVPLKKSGDFALGNDGIAVDCAGNVYEHGGTIHDPQGQQLGRFPGGTNMAFGGPDGTLLMMVEGQGAHVAQMNLPGLP